MANYVLSPRMIAQVAEVNRQSTIQLNKIAEERKKTIEEHR